MGKWWLCDDVSIEVRAGERVGLIGRNGSGKSTLLKLIAGVLQPTLGSVRVEGNVQSMLELGVGFNPDFTGRENIMLHGSLLGLRRREILDRFPEITAFAEIGDFMDRSLKHYSSGMVLRLAFAVFVLVHPEILIIDEAMAVGDIFFQQRCYDFLRGPLADATQIIVSHDPAQLAALCSRLIILEGGKLDYDGPDRARDRALLEIAAQRRYPGRKARPCRPFQPSDGDRLDHCYGGSSSAVAARCASSRRRSPMPPTDPCRPARLASGWLSMRSSGCRNYART